MKLDSVLKLLVCALVMCSFVLTSPVVCQTASVNAGLHNQDVIDLLKAGISQEIVIAKIKTSESAFDTSPAALKELKSADVPEAVILAIVEAAAPKNVATPALDNPTGDEFGHLRVYRPRRFVGSALAPSIWVDKVQVARVGSGRHCSIRLRPGTYEIRSDDKSSLITLEVRRGREYYIRVDEEPGAWKGHGKLTLMAVEQGTGEYKLQRPVEEERKMAKEMLEAETESINPEQQGRAEKLAK